MRSTKKIPIYLSTEEICLAMAVLTQATEELESALPEGIDSLSAKKLDEIAGSIWSQLEADKLVTDGRRLQVLN